MSINEIEITGSDMESGKNVAADWGYEEHIFPNPKYPFFIKKKYKKPDSKWVPHWHENPEIILIDKGKANISIDGELFYGKEGDVIVVNSSCMHRLYPVEGSVEYTVIIVSLLLFNDIDINVKAHRLETVIQDEEVNKVISSLLSDFKSEEPYSLAMTKANIISLLVYLFRNHESLEAHTGKERISSSRRLAQSAMEYIHLHYAEDISTATLAKKFAVSVNYLCRCFNQCTGFTVIDHLNYVRCTAAKAMLSNTDDSVSEVALAVGFNNLSYFGRQYKKFFGHTPSKTEKLPAEIN